MNKKLVALIAILALGVGGFGAMAYQTRAQSIPATVQSSSTVTASTAPVGAATVNDKVDTTGPDTDNIQDESGAKDQQGTAVNEAADTEVPDATEAANGSTPDAPDAPDTATTK